MLIINKLYCRNTATTVLQYSTKFTTSTTFLQKWCFFYNVEFLNKTYVVVYQLYMGVVELVESVEIVSYL